MSCLPLCCAAEVPTYTPKSVCRPICEQGTLNYSLKKKLFYFKQNPSIKQRQTLIIDVIVKFEQFNNTETGS